MKCALGLGVLLWASVAVGSAIAYQATRPNELAIIHSALERNLCFEVYWWGREYRKGVQLAVQIKIRGGEFLAWIHDLEVKKQHQMDGFYKGKIGEGRAAVSISRGYNVALKPLPPTYFDDRQHFESGVVLSEKLTIPTDCTPRYDPPTPQKESMVRTVVNTLKIRLSEFVRKRIARYPAEVTLIIADFNPDYPETLVLVEPNEELYVVTLHNPQNYDSGEYESKGEYPLGERRGEQHLLDKIRRHGIIQKIVLAP